MKVLWHLWVTTLDFDKKDFAPYSNVANFTFTHRILSWCAEQSRSTRLFAGIGKANI